MAKNQPLARSLLLLVWCVCAVMLAAAHEQATAFANDWPQWRGPNRTNISAETGLVKEWLEQGPPLVWQVEGIGRGITSVAVAGGRIYTVGYHYPVAPVIRTPNPRRRGFRRTEIPRGEYVIALDADSGRLLWATRVGEAVFENHLMRWLSQRTPTVDGDRLYALTAAGELVCLQTRDGAELWRKNYTDDFGGVRSRWGYCDYPLVDGVRLICTPGGPDATVVALNKRTGELVWKSSLPDHRGHAYAATVVCKAGGLPHYVASTQGGLVGVSADDGTLLWSFNRNASSFNAITPIVRDNDLFCARMYRGKSIHRLGIDRSEGVFSVVEELSHQPRGDVINPFQDDMLLVGGRIYTSGQSRGLACINADSLQLVWTASELADGRLSLDRGMAGMVYADERLYVRYNDGTMTLVELQRDGCQERGAFQILGSQPSIGVTMPVISGGHLLLRDDERLFCYDIRRRNRPSSEPGLVQLNLSSVVDAKVAQADAAFQSVFVPTPHNMVGKMLEIADVKRDDVCCDLGSGDGRIVIAAAKLYGCRAIGYEISGDFVDESRRAAQAAGVETLVTIEPIDIFEADLRDVTVVTLYLLPEQNAQLLPQLGKLAHGCRIVAYQNPIPGVRPDRVVRVDSDEDGTEHTMYLWTTPLNVPRN